MSTTQAPVVRIKDVPKHGGQRVTIRGWVHNIRASDRNIFVVLRDGTSYIQATLIQGKAAQDAFRIAKDLTHESSVEFTGKVYEDDRMPSGYGLDARMLKVFQRVSAGDPFPIEPREHGIEFLMDNRHLWLRSTRQRAIMKVRHEVINAIREGFYRNDFTLFDTPILQPEPGLMQTAFKTQYGEDSAFLAQTGRFYLAAGAMALGNVYSLGPRFRDTKSKTRRHLTEFWMVEAEMPFATLLDSITLGHSLVSDVINRVLETCGAELKVLGRDPSMLEKAANKKFPGMTYDDAVIALQNRGSDVTWGESFCGGDETMLSVVQDSLLLIHRHPETLKAFDAGREVNSGQAVASALTMELLVPEGYGQIATGMQITDDLDLVEQRIRERNMKRGKALESYLDLFRYGAVSRSSFSLNVERLLLWICGLDHVREAIPFPRVYGRVNP